MNPKPAVILAEELAKFDRRTKSVARMLLGVAAAVVVLILREVR